MKEELNATGNRFVQLVNTNYNPLLRKFLDN